MKIGTEYYFYQNDHLGTPQKMTTVSGAVVWSAKYSSFGKAEVDPASTVTNNLRFPGQYFDQETELHYNKWRYYDAKIGRYLRNDPVEFISGINFYTYVLNNPVNLFDPSGLRAINWGKFASGVRYIAQGEVQAIVGFGLLKATAMGLKMLWNAEKAAELIHYGNMLEKGVAYTDYTAYVVIGSKSAVLIGLLEYSGIGDVAYGFNLLADSLVNLELTEEERQKLDEERRCMDMKLKSEFQKMDQVFETLKEIERADIRRKQRLQQLEQVTRSYINSAN